MKNTFSKFSGTFAVTAMCILMGSLNSGCPSTTETNLENARFALDRCNPSDSTTDSYCEQAVNDAQAVLTADPTNVEAAILVSSGYLGWAGVDFLRFASELLDVQSSSNSEADFQEFRTLVRNVETASTDTPNPRTISLPRLRSAVSVLETTMAGLTITIDDDLRDSALFQLGAIQTLENFVLPIKLITIDLTDDHIDPSEIGDTEAAVFKQNAANSDNNLQSSGTDDESTLKATREGDCRCRLADPRGTNYGAPCLRDLMRCELSTTETENTEQDYDGDGVCGETGVTTCATAGGRTGDCNALINPPGVESCKSSGT